MALTPSAASGSATSDTITATTTTSSRSTVVVSSAAPAVTTSSTISAAAGAAPSVSGAAVLGTAATAGTISTSDAGVVTPCVVPGSLLVPEEEHAESILEVFMGRLEAGHQETPVIVPASRFRGEASWVTAIGGAAGIVPPPTPPPPHMEAAGGSGAAPPWDTDSAVASSSGDDRQPPRHHKKRRIVTPAVEEPEEEPATSEGSGQAGRHGPLASTVSWSWDHFTLPDGGTVSYSPVVVCKHCGKEVKRGNPMKDGKRVCLGTSSLISHLKNRHKEVYAAHLTADRAPSGIAEPEVDAVPPSLEASKRKSGARGKVPTPPPLRQQERRRQRQAKAPRLPPPPLQLPMTTTRTASAAAGALFPPQNEVGSLYVPPPGNYPMVPLYFGVDQVCRVCQKRISCGESVTPAREGSIFLHYLRDHPNHLPRLLEVRDVSDSSSDTSSNGGNTMSGSDQEEADAGPRSESVEDSE